MVAVLAATSVVAALGVIGSLMAGSILSAPLHHSVGEPPTDLSLEAISFRSGSGATIRGWLGAGRPDRPVALLFHGVRADRCSMVNRARFLSRAGYGVLMIDFQAHGESDGERITFGVRESLDARSACDFVEARFPGRPRVAIGVSMGGAAALLGPAPLDVRALVVEQVYSTIERAIENRIAVRLGPLAPALAPLLIWQLEPRMGVRPADLRPIDRISSFARPILVIAGEDDPLTVVDEPRAMFERAREPKQLWIVPGAGHVDLIGIAGPEYERRVLDFFEIALPRPSSSRTIRFGGASRQASASTTPFFSAFAFSMIFSWNCRGTSS